MQKRFRLTRNEDFKAVIVKKVSASNRSFVGYIGPNTCGHARVGISIRAHYGHAVARNRAKRQVRAMCDQLIDLSKSLDFVIIIRDAFQTRSYAENTMELTYLYQKLLTKR